MTDAAAPWIGRTLARRYDVLALIGAGGMGTVYRARDRELDELVALKLLRGDLAHDAAALARFRAEVKLARRVTHGNIARTFELGFADDVAFCTMELVEGETLRSRLERDGSVPLGEAIAIACAVCDGLAAAHAAGIVHRDIKPDNVLVTPAGRVVVADFGVAAIARAELLEVSGTVAYMAPEQLRGDPARAETDVYAVGALLFELATGMRPFPGFADALPAEHALAAIIARASAERIADRIATAAELGRALAAQAIATSPAAPPITAAPVAERTVIVLAPRTESGFAHVALGVHEELLARLVRKPGVRTVARESATGEAADCVVELTGGHRLTATIRRATGGATSLTLPLEVAEIERTAASIASAVWAALDPEPPALSPAAAEAIEIRLVARARSQAGFSGVLETLALLERANALRPDDPQIMASLAICDVRAVFFARTTPVERLARAHGLVQAALAAAPERAESQIAAGLFALHVGQPIAAARRFREAIARAPHVAEGHEQLGSMLLEAGFPEAGLARLDVALAISPALGTARWDIARARALDGRWEDYDRLVATLDGTAADRMPARLRHACWRRDLREIARLRQLMQGRPWPDIPTAVAAIADVALNGDWAAQRGAIVERALAPSASRRRNAFDLQLGAEAAGYSGDAETCMMLVERFADVGAYDLTWIDRCPVLAVARALPAMAAARARVASRASAILDVLYGDSDETQPENEATVVL